VYRDELTVSSGGSRSPFARVFSRLHTAFKIIHESIVAAKSRRLRSELMFHSGAGESWSPRMEADATQFARRPLILGEKWDF
jgi:hypothetical protein